MTRFAKSCVRPRSEELSKTEEGEMTTAPSTSLKLASNPLILGGVAAAAVAAGIFYYFQPELRRYIRMRRM